MHKLLPSPTLGGEFSPFFLIDDFFKAPEIAGTAGG